MTVTGTGSVLAVRVGGTAPRRRARDTVTATVTAPATVTVSATDPATVTVSATDPATDPVTDTVTATDPATASGMLSSRHGLDGAGGWEMGRLDPRDRCAIRRKGGTITGHGR